MSAKAPEATRRKLLAAAFTEVYRHGFQGGSLARIVEAAGTTKGALFHHFAGKQDLGYAVLDEVIAPLLEDRWLAPLVGATNPLAELARAFRRHVRADIASGAWLQGCPLNNLAQEMSPLDEGFRARIEGLYARWRAVIEAALVAGVKAGTVRKGARPERAAAFIVASQMGIWGSAKGTQDEAVMVQAGEALCDYLDGLGP